MKKSFGFTLAELMIVMTVMGVLAGILIPIANNSRPDENVMKFKKANVTLGNVIRELVTSDKYYADGDLGKKPDGSLISGSGNYDYFCQTIADILSTKNVSCKTDLYSGTGAWLLSNTSIPSLSAKVKKTVTQSTIAATKAKFDSVCKSNAASMGKEIEISDGVIFYQANTSNTFGFNSATTPTCPQRIANTCTVRNGVGYSTITQCSSISNSSLECPTGQLKCTKCISKSTCLSDGSGKAECKCEAYCISAEDFSYRIFSSPNESPAFIGDSSGFDIAYKIYCIDVDGIPDEGSANCDDKKDICPFGYGIRADGKILPGARADEWTNKSIQKGGNKN